MKVEQWQLTKYPMPILDCVSTINIISSEIFEHSCVASLYWVTNDKDTRFIFFFFAANHIQGSWHDLKKKLKIVVVI